MPVSADARKKVIEASGGMCELFHDVPVPGEHITHFIHQGQGGASEDSERNSSDNLLYCCKDCHDLIDGRMRNNHPIIVEFSRDAGILELVDDERRVISHDRIFFHQWPTWREAIETYPILVDSIRRRNEAEFDLAKALAYFKPTKRGPELWRVCPETKQMRLATFWTFVSLLGMTSATAKELMPVGAWLNEEEMESVRGVDLDAIDAIRKVPPEDVERLLGLTSKPPLFWSEVNALSENKHGKRTHYMMHNAETGELEDLGLLSVAPDVAEAFALIRGCIVKGGKEA